MKIEFIFAIFALLGVIDRVTGNRLKLGEEFEKGIMTTGALVLAMAGTMVLAPALAEGLKFIFTPLFELLKIDLSVIAIFFANDAGGAALAYELSDNELLRGYNGNIVASMFGATIGLIPMALRMVAPKYHNDVLSGLLCGIATIPLGCIAGGLVVGCSFTSVLLNTAPVIILSALICVGLALNPSVSIKVFGIIGKILIITLIGGLGIGIFYQLTGIKLISNISPLSDSLLIICNIAMILSGVFPFIKIISKVFSKVFEKIGKSLKIDETSVLGLVTTLANTIPMLEMVEHMNRKGRIMNMAFAVSAAYIIGDHLAFTLSFDRKFLLGMVIGKLISGLSSLILAHIFYKYIDKK